MRILNLYAGIGGNRKLWGNDHDITAVEIDANIALVYKKLYPEDNVIVDDAHEYLRVNYKDYDFIWASPPCPSHSRARFGFGVCGHGYEYIYPDVTLWQEIILLKHCCGNQLWCVENVIPYYDPLIEPDVKIGRHYYWTNFYVAATAISTNNMIAGNTIKPTGIMGHRGGEIGIYEELYGFDLSSVSGIDKRKVLRNCVEPEIGKHILDSALEKEDIQEQTMLF